MQNVKLEQITLAQQKRESDRRALVSLSGQALSAAKQSIFKLQRKDSAGAAADLSRVEQLLREAGKICRRDNGLSHEGVWRAAQEEACEAILVYDFLVKDKLMASKLPTDDPEILVGGLSDFTGELARYAVIKATEGDRAMIEKSYAVALQIIEALLRLDLTGSLRSKFDQAKQHLRKLEEIRYELSRRV